MQRSCSVRGKVTTKGAIIHKIESNYGGNSPFAIIFHLLTIGNPSLRSTELTKSTFHDLSLQCSRHIDRWGLSTWERSAY